MTFAHHKLDHFVLYCRMVRIAKNDIVLNDIVIRKDTRIAIPIYAIHHDPEVWPDPDKFDPERYVAPSRKETYERARAHTHTHKHTHARTCARARTHVTLIAVAAAAFSAVIMQPL